MKSYKYLSWDLHDLVENRGEYDRDKGPKIQNFVLCFKFIKNNKAEMMGSRVR